MNRKEPVFVYIYVKGVEIKVLGHNDAYQFDQTDHDWKHVATINACTWIEQLWNSEDKLQYVLDLTK